LVPGHAGRAGCDVHARKIASDVNKGLHMYSKEFFVERFQNEETEDLLNRYTTGDLTDSAKEAVLQILKKRGFSEERLWTLAKQARKASYRQTKGTKECDFCGNSARFSKVIDAGQRFCSTTCLQNARLLEISEDIPDEEIEKYAYNLKNGECPKCHKILSKVEVRKFYNVWSAVIFTRWTKQTHVCCKSCGREKNVWSIIFCLLFGWWGIPWGLFATPIQIISNAVEIFNSRNDDPSPSDELLQVARIKLASNLTNTNQH
jgi:predicted house-cleaning noncanonical NTP pyrophosphatase (MazG superfamily)